MIALLQAASAADFGTTAGAVAVALAVVRLAERAVERYAPKRAAPGLPFGDAGCALRDSEHVARAELARIANKMEEAAAAQQRAADALESLQEERAGKRR